MNLVGAFDDFRKVAMVSPGPVLTLYDPACFPKMIATLRYLRVYLGEKETWRGKVVVVVYFLFKFRSLLSTLPFYAWVVSPNEVRCEADMILSDL